MSFGHIYPIIPPNSPYLSQQAPSQLNIVSLPLVLSSWIWMQDQDHSLQHGKPTSDHILTKNKTNKQKNLLPPATISYQQLLSKG